ncbi:MAG TPA: hypothetical protein PL009_14795 [Flavipsychrobacter sp.]|nr:hypothetical protein [Flavipsychrobacter sp.]
MKNLTLLGLMAFAFQCQAGVIIDTVKIMTNSTVGKYEKFEVGIVSLSISPSVFNVYDSSSVDMYAIFTAPSGKKYRRNAFWMTQYSRCDTCANNVYLSPSHPEYCSSAWDDTTEYSNPSDPKIYLKPLNTSYNWRVRFAPPETGTQS